MFFTTPLQPDSFGSSEELALPRLIRCELSRLHCHGHNRLSSSYLCRIKQKENSSYSACEHPMQDLTSWIVPHLCLSNAPSLALYFHFWPLVQTLRHGPTVWSPWSSSTPPSLGRGRAAVPPPLTLCINVFCYKHCEQQFCFE